MDYEAVYLALEESVKEIAGLVTYNGELCILYYTDERKIPGTPVKTGTAHYVPVGVTLLPSEREGQILTQEMRGLLLDRDLDTLMDEIETKRPE